MAEKRVTKQEALDFHSQGKPGKIELSPTKPLNTQRDLSLAYSPGVAFPCLEIEENPASAYELTNKGNMVAVISNGTAVLGLGNIGALASKPVMEGKAVLFKRFADVDGIDLEVDTEEVDEFINCVKFLGKSFGGINLEDIKAPECFIIEQQLREIMDIPVFHDDQHGTAIIATAGLINGLHLTNRNITNTKLVVNGAGAASIACVELLLAMGMPSENIVLCDSKGVVYKGREEGMNQWKAAHAAETSARTLAEAMEGADVFYGLSVKDAVSKDMVKSMADKPLIFAMANPDPEITPEDVRSVRDDAIIATGRSDYPNQINNVLGFPYIFRGALDVRATSINDDMKIAAAEALAKLARADVPDEVDAAYGGERLSYGPDYLIPVPFDPRLISEIPPAVAEAAMKSGVAKQPIQDMAEYKRKLSSRLDPIASALHFMYERVHSNPQRVIFAEGEEDRVIRAAIAYSAAGYGKPILIGRDDEVLQKMGELGIENYDDVDIVNLRKAPKRLQYADFLYERLQRHGYLLRDCQRLLNQDRNVFAACMVACGDADAIVTGATRSFSVAFEDVTRVIDPCEGEQVMGLQVIVSKGQTVFIADTRVNERPSAEELADIAVQSANYARRFGHEPRVAFLSFANFGQPLHASNERIGDAIKILENRKVDFEFEGEMTADTALNHDLMKSLYPFSRLSGAANVLIMPGLHAANIAGKLLQEIGGGTVIGPVMLGFEKPVQIVQMGATTQDLLNAAVLAANDALP